MVKIKYAGDIILQSITNTAVHVSDPADQLNDIDIPPHDEPTSLEDVVVIAVDNAETNMCSICKAAAVPGEEKKFKCKSCASIMLKTSL